MILVANPVFITKVQRVNEWQHEAAKVNAGLEKGMVNHSTYGLKPPALLLSLKPDISEKIKTQARESDMTITFTLYRLNNSTTTLLIMPQSI